VTIHQTPSPEARLYEEQQRLAYWERMDAINQRALQCSTQALVSQREALAKAEERVAAAAELTGL
jgi:hypothetical protein